MRRGRLRCRPAGWRSWQQLGGYGMMLFVGLGRSEMGSLMDWLQEVLIAQARELEARITANVAGLLNA